MRSRIKHILALALALCALLACLPAMAASGGAGEAGVRIIVASPKKLTLEPEATYQLAVAAKDGAPLPQLQWTSSDPEIVSVDSQGRLTALKNGSAKIVVTSTDGTTDSSACRVTVKAAKVIPIDAPIEGNVYDYNYNRVSSSTEAAVRAYCEKLGDSRAEKMMRKAVGYVGTPYSKVDCSKLVQLTYKSRGVKLSRVSDDQAEDMYKYRREDGAAQVGDVYFMKFPAAKKCNCGSASCRRFMEIHHSAMYLGKIDGRTYVVDSSSAIGNVIIREFTSNTIAGMPVVFVAGK